MERTKLGLSKDKMYKALGEGERTSKKVASIRMSDGSTFKRKNANQYGTAEGGNDYTEKRSNRTDRFDLGGTADSSNTGANMGGTMGSSIMKHGGKVDKFIIGDVVYNKKQKTIGIVRDIFDRNDLRTDADGVVDMDILEIYNKSNPKHQKGKIANSTRMELVKKLANGGGLADVPESFPSNDAVSYKTGGSVIKGKQKLTGDDLDTYNFFIREGDTKEQAMQGVLNARKDRKKNKENESFYKRAYEYKEGGTTKNFEYTIGGL